MSDVDVFEFTAEACRAFRQDALDKVGMTLAEYRAHRLVLDDEINDERPTPEVAADYLHRCATEVLRVYSELPAEAVAGADDED